VYKKHGALTQLIGQPQLSALQSQVKPELQNYTHANADLDMAHIHGEAVILLQFNKWIYPPFWVVRSSCRRGCLIQPSSIHL